MIREITALLVARTTYSSLRELAVVLMWLNDIISLPALLYDCALKLRVHLSLYLKRVEFKCIQRHRLESLSLVASRRVRD